MSTDPLSEAFSTLIAQAKADLLKPVNTSIDNILATPSTQNVVGQGGQFLASLVPLLPLLEGQGITDLFTAIKTALNAPTAPATTPASVAVSA